MNSFPADLREWKNDVQHRLMRLRGSVNDIFMTMPQIPDPEIGSPFSGPLSPVPFVWPLVDRSGGTPNTGGTINTGGTPNTVNTGGTLNTVGGCVGARFMNFTFAGISCAPLNGTFKLSASAPLIGVCRWQTAGTDRWYFLHLTGTNQMELNYSPGSGGIVAYSAAGIPPMPGNSIVMTRTTNTTGCTGFPATQTVTGSDT